MQVKDDIRNTWPVLRVLIFDSEQSQEAIDYSTNSKTVYNLYNNSNLISNFRIY